MSAAEGLESYGWWADYRPAIRDQMRAWVREVLLARPHMTQAECDRFIASLGAQKVDDLGRRAYQGRGAGGF